MPAAVSVQQNQNTAGNAMQQSEPRQQDARPAEAQNLAGAPARQQLPAPQNARSEQSNPAAPRQRVLFVLRVSGRPLPEASETGGQSGDRAKQSPAPGNATPAPSK